MNEYDERPVVRAAGREVMRGVAGGAVREGFGHHRGHERFLGLECAQHTRSLTVQDRDLVACVIRTAAEAVQRQRAGYARAGRHPRRTAGQRQIGP